MLKQRDLQQARIVITAAGIAKSKFAKVTGSFSSGVAPVTVQSLIESNAPTAGKTPDQINAIAAIAAKNNVLDTKRIVCALICDKSVGSVWGLEVAASTGAVESVSRRRASSKRCLACCTINVRLRSSNQRQMMQ
jgi:hypothetical protein